jgi:hypothetical protein
LDLEPQPTVAVGEHPVSQVVLDFDGDGDLDVVVPAYFGETISLLANDGRGRLTARSIPLLGNPVAVAAGDLDEDGSPDLAVALTSRGTIRILLGPDFRPGVDVALDNPGALALADLDADGHLDLVGARFEPGALRLLAGDGRGGFGPARDLEGPAGVSCVHAADVDADGTLDLIATGGNADQLAVYPGALGPPALLDTGEWPTWVGGFQLDDDPERELIVAANLGDSIQIVDEPARRMPTGHGPFAAAAGDLDGDGAPDIAVTNKFEDTLTIFASAAGTPLTLPTGGGPTPIDLADLDGDGRLDVVVADGFSNDVLVYLSR